MTDKTVSITNRSNPSDYAKLLEFDFHFKLIELIITRFNEKFPIVKKMDSYKFTRQFAEIIHYQDMLTGTIQLDTSAFLANRLSLCPST